MKLRLLLLPLIIALAGCGGGAKTQSLPNTNPGTGGSDYNGPAPATADVQAFRLNVWDNLRSANRCGGCHGTGGQTPQFVRTDDVNLAYQAANTVVSLDSPQDSRLVTKVGGGHNCWLSSNSACADVITAYISAWAGGVTSGGTQIELTAPALRDPGQSKSFPADPTLFAATVHPLLTQYCAGCHTSTGGQAPFFASSDVQTAYDAVKSKIDLDTPANSRLVLRLGSEFHNCWSDCAANAATMASAIASFASQIPLTSLDPALVPSKALRLTDGIVAAGGNRYEGSLIAKWEFKTGEGSTAYDTSGVEPAINLSLSGDVNWVGGWGIEIRGGKAQGSTAASRKLASLIRSTGEYSIEAWVAPANVSQEGPARIVSYSGGANAVNFTLGQSQYNYDFLHRSSTTGAAGMPALSTADADEDLQATLQHVVVSFDPAGGRRIYVNGVHTGDLDPAAGGNLNDWDDSFAFVLGNEVSNDRPWAGTIRFVAVYNRALNAAQVLQNFDAGVGERFYLLFYVGHLIDVPQSYILFEVAQFDSYSYLFHRPTFISLDANAQAGGDPIAGMRIGINGREASVGQAYRHLNTTLGSLNQVLSEVGTVIALEKGADADEFFLTFERLGGHTNVVVEATPVAPTPVDLDASPDVGLRTFDEIDATLATVTGVSRGVVRSTFNTIKQQLPTVERIDGFLAAHQVAVSQLAIEYCSALVEDTTLRASYFPGFSFSAPASSAFDTAAERDLVIDPLLNRVMGSGLSSQPAAAEVKTELENLITRLTACGNGCAADRTEAVVKAVCSATVGSAVMLVQ